MTVFKRETYIYYRETYIYYCKFRASPPNADGFRIAECSINAFSIRALKLITVKNTYSLFPVPFIIQQFSTQVTALLFHCIAHHHPLRPSVYSQNRRYNNLRSRNTITRIGGKTLVICSLFTNQHELKACYPIPDIPA